MSERYETRDIQDRGTTWRTDITRDNGELGTPVYATKPGETYTPRNQSEYFYRGHIRDDGTHDVYRIPMTHISKDNPPSEYIGNFTKEQIQNGDHRK